MQLTWQQALSLERKPAKRKRLAPCRNTERQIEFIEEHPERPLCATASSTVTLTGSSCTRYASRKTFTDAVAREGYFGCEPDCDRFLESTDVSINNSMMRACSTACSAEADGPLESVIDEETRVDEDWPDSRHQITLSHLARSPVSQSHEHVHNSMMVPASTNILSPTYISQPQTLEYGSVTERYKPILERYNSEFCTIPLTFALRTNPFRYRADIFPEPVFLVHAVMALAGHHVDSKSTLNHRHTSLRSLRQSLDVLGGMETMYSVLDTIIILFSLDESQSLLGNWSTHLTGAYNLLEACGGIGRLPMTSRIQAQIGILTWWDAIVSLLARESCVFPYSYFAAILSNQHRREWDFSGLCGCPTSLVKIVMKLARLSVERRKSLSETKSEEVKAILELEQSLESWTHVSSTIAFYDEAHMHQDRDIMHCSEAWRNGLLLYIFRVFHWKSGCPVPMHILYRARVIVDHVVSCRNEDMITRQALFPLFLAGCELQDQCTRTQILDLCSRWDEMTRYRMFGSTIPLLKDIWAEQENRGFENVWWGQIVDRQHESRDEPLKMRLCFG